MKIKYIAQYCADLERHIGEAFVASPEEEYKNIKSLYDRIMAIYKNCEEYLSKIMQCSRSIEDWEIKEAEYFAINCENLGKLLLELEGVKRKNE
jgi:uncharacterized Fe-S cluster-containing protein